MSSDATAPRKSSATTKKIIFCAESRVLLPLIAIYMFFLSQLTKDRNPCIYATPTPTLLIKKKKKRQKNEDGEHSPKMINRIKTGKNLFIFVTYNILLGECTTAYPFYCR